MDFFFTNSSESDLDEIFQQTLRLSLAEQYYQDNLDQSQRKDLLNSKAELTPKEKIVKEKIYELDWIEDVPAQYFPLQLKNFIKEHLVCQICWKFMEEVVEFECKHISCDTCFKSINKQRYLGQVKCPFCNHMMNSVQKNLSLRQRLLQFYVRQLPVPCFICYEQLPRIYQVNQEESKETLSQNIWSGSFEDLVKHCGHHLEEKCVGQEYVQLCQYEHFGCKKVFSNNLVKSTHEGVDCDYRWLRCNKCLKIYFKQDYKKHFCKPDDFYSNSEHNPQYGMIQNKLLYVHQLTIIYFNSQNQSITQVLMQIKKFFDFQQQCHQSGTIQVESVFMYRNLMEALNSQNLKLKAIEIEKKPQEIPIQLLSPSEIFFRKYLQNKRNLPQNDDQTSDRTTQIQQAIKYAQSLKNQAQSLKNQANNEKKSSVFVSCIVADSKKEAQQQMKQGLQVFGVIKSSKIFGVGTTGKFYGVIQFEDKNSAKSALRVAQMSQGRITFGLHSFNVAANKK